MGQADEVRHELLCALSRLVADLAEPSSVWTTAQLEQAHLMATEVARRSDRALAIRRGTTAQMPDSGRRL